MSAGTFAGGSPADPSFATVMGHAPARDLGCEGSAAQKGGK